MKEFKHIIAADFETTTDNTQKVAVWSAEAIEVGKDTAAVSENCVHQDNIADFIAYWAEFTRRYGSTCIYFHNLKFDGSYILDYLKKSDAWKEYSFTSEASGETVLLDKVEKGYDSEIAMPSMSYTYTVTNMNVMYDITLKIRKRKMLVFRDSLKLLPFTLKKIGKDFKTEHQKLEMEFSGKYEGYVATPEEMKYIENDVFVLKEALEKFSDITGRDISELPMTIGAECMREYREIFRNYSDSTWKEFFPKQTEEGQCTKEEFCNFDRYCRRAYKGGWCYVKEEQKGVEIWENGEVYDVNSLYPSMMHSISGCFYPHGHGTYHVGEPDSRTWDFYHRKQAYFFMHVRCRFNIKKDHLPCIQIKNDFLYDSREWLKSSDYVSRRTGKRVEHVADLYITCTDWELIQRQYDLDDVEYVSYVIYAASAGIFDEYIDKWMKIKMTSKGAMRTLAKLMLNNLYGKFSTSPEADYQTYEVRDGVLKGKTTELEDTSRAIYIPVGAAITSWARNFTITHAQQNFEGFLYADTDSIHMVGKGQGIEEDPVKLCCWKNESSWDHAIFTGQKRYIEHVTHEDKEPCENYDNVKCCGMGQGAKDNFIKMMLSGDKGYKDFKKGLVVPGNLKGHRVNGGIILEEKEFTMR